MHVLTLKRIAETNDGTFGVIIENAPICLSLERVWDNNKTDTSCIPTGEYQCNLNIHPSHGLCWQVMNVPNRTDILIHKGNTESDSEGCILLGAEYGIVNGVNGIINSGIAYTTFMAYLNGETEFKLVVV